jgi:hypothetical protein
MQKNMFIIFIYKISIRNNWLVYIKPERFNTLERSVSLVPQGGGWGILHTSENTPSNNHFSKVLSGLVHKVKGRRYLRVFTSVLNLLYN